MGDRITISHGSLNLAHSCSCCYLFVHNMVTRTCTPVLIMEGIVFLMPYLHFLNLMYYLMLNRALGMESFSNHSHTASLKHSPCSINASCIIKKINHSLFHLCTDKGWMSVIKILQWANKIFMSQSKAWGLTAFCLKKQNSIS